MNPAKRPDTHSTLSPTKKPSQLNYNHESTSAGGPENREETRLPVSEALERGLGAGYRRAAIRS